MNNLFKTVTDQSSEMVFFVEKVFPHAIVYGNKAFQDEIGRLLSDKSLRGLGVDINTMLFQEENIVGYNNDYYSFIVEGSQTGIDYYLFQKGSKVILPGSEDSLDIFNKQLKAEENFFKNLLDKIPTALFQMVMDDRGKMSFKYFSESRKGMFDVYGKDKDHFKSIDFLLSRVHPDDIGMVLKTIVYSTRSMSHWRCEFRIIINPDEGPRWVIGVASPESLPSGINWYGSIIDIADIKERELALESAKKAAEESSRTKSDFISMITHEIRTPLNAISGSVYSLFGEEHSKLQEGPLNTINFAVDNLIIMINDLLDFQKIESGKMSIESKPFNVKQLLGQVVNGLKYQAHESKNQVNLIVSDRLDIKVLGDKVRLSQVLNNLMTNALKFTNEGRVNLTATLVQDTENQVRVYFEVKDTGIGIAREDFKKVFNEFDQVNHSFDVKYGGTGLGMPITKRLLENMGSQIQLESEVGVGSTFFFEITFDKYFAENNIEVYKPTIVETETPLEKTLVLLAEDNDVNAIVIMKIIRRWGFECERVCNGAEALRAVDLKSYDIILMDLQMPVMDGYEAARLIKEKTSIPIIALTAASKSELQNRMEDRLMDSFISKPIDALELQGRIKELVKAHKV
ncbi:ATP-binding protein [Echinicola sp. 20G]|uniref:ATP-binding protein n=1 Tax=Echinicola sp. 20G TaxID=2781961 RepID=UPI001F405F8E|nr:ATP-binding protein [Echinicola sp. 20G]